MRVTKTVIVFSSKFVFVSFATPHYDGPFTVFGPGLRSPPLGTVRFDRLRQNRSDFPAAEVVASLLATFRLPLSRPVVHLYSCCPFPTRFFVRMFIAVRLERVTRFTRSSGCPSIASFLVTFVDFPVVLPEYSHTGLSACIEEPSSSEILFVSVRTRPLSSRDQNEYIIVVPEQKITEIPPEHWDSNGFPFDCDIRACHRRLRLFLCVSPGAPDIAVQANPRPPFRCVYFSLYAHT